MFEVKNIKKTGYGYEIDNAINTLGVLGSDYYLKNMKAKNGHILKIVKDCSKFNEKLNKAIDIYFVFVYFT